MSIVYHQQWDCFKNFPYTATPIFIIIITQKRRKNIFSYIYNKKGATQKKINRQNFYTNNRTYTRDTRVVIIYDFLQWIGIVWWCLFIYVYISRKILCHFNTCGAWCVYIWEHHQNSIIYVALYCCCCCCYCMRCVSNVRYIKTVKNPSNILLWSIIFFVLNFLFHHIMYCKKNWRNALKCIIMH